MDTPPDSKEILFQFGPYQILKILGHGGMGEVYLAYDPDEQRNIAIKKILTDYGHDHSKRDHILQEVQIARRLVHPAIIPVYSVVIEENMIYYTMPYIEGKSLKQFVAEAREHSTENASVSALLPIFLTISQAVAYAHSQGVLHRDIKASNVLIGPYGEVRMIDWGVAGKIDSEEISQAQPLPTKVTGTTPYLAPEQTLGKQASIQTEVYSLGLILYQMLTLRFPFHRDTLLHFRETMEKEVAVDPAIASPFRGITPLLSHITLKCLAYEPEKRYQTVNELVDDLKVYLREKSGWITLDSNIAETTTQEIPAIPTSLCTIWRARQLISEEFKVELDVEARSSDDSGIGFLIHGNENETNGICLWLGSNFLFSLGHNTPVYTIPYTTLQQNAQDQLVLEKSNGRIQVILNGILQFVLPDYLPNPGQFLSIITRQSTFSRFSLSVNDRIYSRNPLLPAHTLFVNNDYQKALREYRLGALFLPDLIESQRALFYAGITLNQIGKKRAAITEFAKLHGTTSAPLELFGKVLLYEQSGNSKKELECYEKACINFLKHPLIHLLYAQLALRLLSSSKGNHLFVLLACRFLPVYLITSPVNEYLKKYRENLDLPYFITRFDIETNEGRASLVQELAYHLRKPDVLIDSIIELLKAPPSNISLLENALYGLIEIGEWERALEKLQCIFELTLDIQAHARFEWIHNAILMHQQNATEIPPSYLDTLPKKMDENSKKSLTLISNDARNRGKLKLAHQIKQLIISFSPYS